MWALFIVLLFFVFSLAMFFLMKAALSRPETIERVPENFHEAREELEEYLRLLHLDDVSLGIAPTPTQTKSLYSALLEAQMPGIIRTGPLSQADRRSIEKAWREKVASPPIVLPPRPRKRRIPQNQQTPRSQAPQ